MKGEITLKLLEAIKSLAVNSADLLDVYLSVGYGASYSKLEYELSKRQKERDRREVEKDFQRQIRQRYYNLIYKLKQSGLIEERKKEGKKFFIITRRGKNKISSLNEQSRGKLPENFYRKEEGNKFIVVIFDVPEKEKRKRVWLRAVLKNLGLKMVQKSVWIGKIKVPKQFLDDLFKLKMVDFVEIFEISKSGSLEHVV